MAGWLAFVKVVTLVLTHVYARTAWVLALNFITWNARLIIALRAWPLCPPFLATTIVVPGVLSGLAWVGRARAAAVIAATIFIATTRIHAVLRGTSPATAVVSATSASARVSTA